MEKETQPSCLCAILSRFSIEERYWFEEKIVRMITNKRPEYKTIKRREIVRNTVYDLLEAIIQNGT